MSKFLTCHALQSHALSAVPHREVRSSNVFSGVSESPVEFALGVERGVRGSPTLEWSIER